MSSANSPNTGSGDRPTPSAARERFNSAAADKMETSREVPAERSLWQGRYSPKAMYGTWAISAILTIAAIVGVAVFAGDQQIAWLIAGSAILIWWCFAIALYFYRRLGMHYELTTQRLVHQIGVLSRRSDRIEVIDIDDVSYTQGIIQRMLGVGTITITSSDRTHPELALSGIDRVPEIASLIDDVRREERRRRSLHIESI